MATRSGPAQIEVTPLGVSNPTTITIPREDQMEDAMITIERLVFEHRTQESAAPAKYIKTGINAGLAVSIANMEKFEYLGLAFSEQVVTQNLTGGGVKQKIELSDDAGLEFAKYKVVIKPYIGATATTDANKWWTFPHACVVSSETFEMAFGLETQQRFNIRFVALPDPNNNRVKVIIGDATATA